MTSKIKVDNITNQSDSNIVNKCGTTITLGASGDTIALASGASQTGFGRTGTVNWDTTAKTTGFTAASGIGYFVDTTSGVITVTLPASPSAGDIVSVADYTNTFQTNPVIVARNGSPIGGAANDAVLSTEGQSVTFVYVDGTEGWKNVQDSTSNVVGNPNLIATGGTITTCGDYKIHTFTGPGTFSVAQISNTPANNTVSYMVIAGGGSGGTNLGGGGGGGGFREYKGPADCYTASPLNGNPGGTAVTVTAQSYPITVGAGGVGTPYSTNSNPGSNSIFSTVTSAGGGGGGGATPSPAGQNGGSGGGASYNCSGTLIGTGNTPPVSPPQGNNGGSGLSGPPAYSAGGGGGASQVGQNSSAPKGGDGGNGEGTEINPSPSYGTPGPSPTARYFSGGGAGSGSSNNSTPGGAAGPGGGGAGGAGPASPNGSAGTANTGGGGGGTANVSAPVQTCGNNGGSGIVIIRYKYQ
jgi:hypothetical protein